MRFELRGTEECTLEIGGTMSLGRLPPVGLEPELEGDRVRVEVLFFRMRGLKVHGAPGPAFDYGEALWRVGVRFEGAPCWLALACDIDDWSVRAMGAVMVRYPVRSADFSFSPVEFAVRDEERRAFLVRVSEGGEQPPVRAPRRTLVISRGALYEIPWLEEATDHRRVAQCRVEEDALARFTFGPDATFAGEGVVHRGRIHRCGLAKRAR